MKDNERLEIFKTAALCRAFEEECFDQIKAGNIKCPTYLSAGQEFIAATLAYKFKERKPLIFAQHRCHSTYIAFGGNLEELIDELLGRPTGCCRGMGGSASIQSAEINMFGHDGLMGSQVPIAVGACFQTKRPTICFVGDGAAEEDYCMAAIAWAGTQRLPILFVVEDNNLSILTEKKVRRSWSMEEFAESVGVEAWQCTDSPEDIAITMKLAGYYDEYEFAYPFLIEISTQRYFWHAGAGRDESDKFTTFTNELIENGRHDIYEENRKLIKDLWAKRLEIQ